MFGVCLSWIVITAIPIMSKVATMPRSMLPNNNNMVYDACSVSCITGLFSGGCGKCPNIKFC